MRHEPERCLNIGLSLYVHLSREWSWAVTLAPQLSTSGRLVFWQQDRAPLWQEPTLASSLWRYEHLIIRRKTNKSVWPCYNLHVPVGFLEPALVPFFSSSADPLNRHHSHTAGGHFSGCWASHRDERLPQCPSKHAGQTFISIQAKLVCRQ